MGCSIYSSLLDTGRSEIIKTLRGDGVNQGAKNGTRGDTMAAVPLIRYWYRKCSDLVVLRTRGDAGKILVYKRGYSAVVLLCNGARFVIGTSSY